MRRPYQLADHHNHNRNPNAPFPFIAHRTPNPANQRFYLLTLFLQITKRGIESIPMLCLVQAEFLRNGWQHHPISGLFRLLGKFPVHRFCFVGFARDGIFEIVGILAYQSSKLRFFGEMLESFRLGCALKEIGKFGVSILAGMLCKQQVFHISEGFAVHGSR